MGRLLLSMSQDALGTAIGVTFQQVQKYEKGINRIGASRLRQISLVLQKPLAFFFDGQHDSDAVVVPTFVNAFVTTSEGLATARAMMRISEPALRVKFIHLLEEMASQFTEPPP